MCPDLHVPPHLTTLWNYYIPFNMGCHVMFLQYWAATFAGSLATCPFHFKEVIDKNWSYCFLVVFLGFTTQLDHAASIDDHLELSSTAKWHHYEWKSYVLEAAAFYAS